MIDQKLRKHIAELYGNDVIVFDNPSFDRSIIGISHDDRVIYEWDKMVEELMADEGMSWVDSEEFISYNTARALPYIGNNSPIILMYSRENILEEG